MSFSVAMGDTHLEGVGREAGRDEENEALLNEGGQ